MDPTSDAERDAPANPAKFDAYASTYEQLHANSIATSGEQPGYFADYKASCLHRLLGSDYHDPILDYGCGVGSLTERLAARYPCVHGVDISEESLQLARKRVPSATFHASLDALTGFGFGTIVVANVLHHVAPAERPALLGALTRLLQPGRGRLVVFEHNPLNPLTRRAVSRCEFDDDAILLSPGELTRLLEQSGLTRVTRRFIVFFPRFLSVFRPLEPHLGWLPVGAQQMTYGVHGGGSLPPSTFL